MSHPLDIMGRVRCSDVEIFKTLPFNRSAEALQIVRKVKYPVGTKLIASGTYVFLSAGFRSSASGWFAACFTM